jgi:hypothetical protein
VRDGDHAVIAQSVIVVCGVAAIWLSQHGEDRVRRWACIFGLCAQPAWFYTTAVHEQWGIFAVSFLYTAAWLRGLRTYWFTKGAA